MGSPSAPHQGNSADDIFGPFAVPIMDIPPTGFGVMHIGYYVREVQCKGGSSASRTAIIANWT